MDIIFPPLIPPFYSVLGVGEEVEVLVAQVPGDPEEPHVEDVLADTIN